MILILKTHVKRAYAYKRWLVAFYGLQLTWYIRHDDGGSLLELQAEQNGVNTRFGSSTLSRFLAQGGVRWAIYIFARKIFLIDPIKRIPPVCEL